MSETSNEPTGPAAVAAQASMAPTAVVESPPPAAMPAREPAPDPRMRLQLLARQLSVASSRRALIEFLQLRRALQ